MGKVTLVGAGPGDAGLITVKGLEKLRKCDVLIYDRLASEELLQEVRNDCELVYVGKKPGAHSMTQEEINQTLVAYGRKYEAVVRLKGGDSFVFGRGGEEILALRAAGIAYEVIPGITSAIAVPELAGIPVTHRGVARSFHVITGHTREENSTGIDYEALAKLEGTLVFLMGLSHIGEITEQLLHYGKASETPATVIAQGTTPQERIVRGVLGNITALVQEAKLESPVIIVIGDTAGYDFKMSVSEKQKTDVKKIYGVIGTAKTIQELSCTLKNVMEMQCEVDSGKIIAEAEIESEEKVKAKVIPLIEMEISKTAHTAELETELTRLFVYDWILFTSKQAVECFFEAQKNIQLDIRAFANCRFGAIGQGTAKALLEQGIHADFIPKESDAESFAREFVASYGASDAQKTRVLLPRALQGDPILGEILQAAGIEVREIKVYDVTGKCYEHFSKIDEIREFVFFSASGVRAFYKELDRRGAAISAGSRCYCIGHKTRGALEVAMKAQQIEIITADIQSVIGLVEKIMEDR